MTRLPDPDARIRRSARDQELIRLDLETITPILGGSAAPRTLDAHDPVRATGIRGQLRFWWRALYVHDVDAAHGPDWAEELARREAALWGGVGRAAGPDKVARSRVDVWVEVAPPSEPNPENPSKAEAYALWPARATSKGEAAAPRWNPGLRFRLYVRCSKAAAQEVTRALKAWIWFGGIGSRTRRGCGSVTVVGEDAKQWLPASVDDIERALGGISLRGARSPRERLDTPSLHGSALCHGKAETRGELAWHKAIEWLCDFRQKPGPDKSFAREPEKKKEVRGKLVRRAGRSKWPEADNVRRLVQARGQWAHTPRYGDEEIVWPRASFGLPIIGQFQTKNIDGAPYRPREPEGFELSWRDSEGEVRDRLASPLIVKALPLAGGRFVPIALWLFRKFPDGEVVLLQAGKTGQDRAASRSAAPFDKLLGRGDQALYAPLDGNDNEHTNMREAFFRWIQERHSNVRRLGS